MYFWIRHSRHAFAIALLLSGLPAPVAAQKAPGANRTDATAAYLDAVRGQPGFLLAMLREMPKGGDLHSHLSGAIYAESFVAWGAQSGSCVRSVDLVALTPPCDSAAGNVPVANALRDDALYGRIIDAWSMRNWSRAFKNGHDHFFSTFGKFSVAGRGHTGEMVAEAAQRAAADRVIYLELMNTPQDGAIALGAKVGWDDDFTRMRDKLREAGLADVVTAARNDFATTLTKKRQLLACDSPSPRPGCSVQIRFLYQVLRGRAPEQVFAQILTAFEAASIDSSIVGLNLVQPEDGYVSMRDFSLHMRIIDYLHGLHPRVRISLHAGELAPGLVPPEGLRFHIRESVEKGHASRIGHGVDIMHEDDALGLLRELAARGVAVEICLTSNDVILGISGKDHPLAQYQAFGVPTLLATDDQGVSRSDMTLEYKRAVEEQGVGYRMLKKMARNSITHAFVQDNVKAQLLARLDRDFAAFEAKWGALPAPRPALTH